MTHEEDEKISESESMRVCESPPRPIGIARIDSRDRPAPSTAAEHWHLLPVLLERCVAACQCSLPPALARRITVR